MTIGDGDLAAPHRDRWAEEPGASAAPAPPLPRRLVGAAGEALLAERERWLLWLPVFLGLGVGLYFLLPVEPPPWLGAAGLVLGLGLGLGAGALGRRRLPLLLVGSAAAAVALGFAATAWRSHWVAAPVLAKRLGPVVITGRVVEANVYTPGLRLVLERLDIDGLDAAETPRKVRVVVRAGSAPDQPLWPGRWVRLRAVLYPPPAPAAPGAFDFARRAYFQGLGGVGYAISRARLVSAPEGQGGGGFPAWMGARRQAVAVRVRAAIAGPPGAIAAALMTGKRGAIPKDVLEAVRDSGLAHLLAISGLHIGLVAGLIFFAVRGGLALAEGVALRYPIKKWAALAAALGAFAYLMLTGATVPTQRAFLMLSLVMLAVALDRTAISMRLVAWAAAAVLLLAPESLLGPSFQMSFAAVVALVAAYELLAQRLGAWRANQGWARRAALYLVAVAITTVVAGWATAPFAFYHFNRVVVFGLAANLVAVPLTALWIMPWAMAAYALMPLGLEALALRPMGWGIEGVIGVAETVAGWPGAVQLFPAMPAFGIVLVSGGGLWLCLWRGRWRLLGVLAIAAGLVTPGLGRGPDVLVDGSGRLFAARAESGALMLSSGRAARVTGEIWLRRAGQRQAAPWPELGASTDGRLSCDPLACLYRARGQVVALVRDPRALAEDCRVADVVVSLVPVRRPCQARVVVDRFDLWRHGGHALWLEGDGARVETVAEVRGRRPWSRPPG
ncbi:MAG: ComEC/Rec2 family competence protein [Alphaproteobacteria bacterium]